MKTLKLDSSYKPIDVIDYLDAFSMVWRSKARLVEVYDEKIVCGNNSYKAPAVIVIKRYINYRFFRIAPTRKNIYQRDNYTCQYCLHRFGIASLTLDHVIPKSKGGDKNWDNLVCCCKKCNQKKGNSFPEEIGMHPDSIPIKPSYGLLEYLGPNIPEQWKPYLVGHRTN